MAGTHDYLGYGNGYGHGHGGQQDHSSLGLWDDEEKAEDLW